MRCENRNHREMLDDRAAAETSSMKRMRFIMPAAALLLLTFLLMLRVSDRHEWQAKGRVRLERGPIHLDPSKPYDPYFLQTHLEIISNLLSSAEGSSELAGRAGLERADFKFIESGPVRSTSIVFVHFAGSTSNGVINVASNACVMIERFYSTNQPTVHVEYFDAYPFVPEPFWQRILDELRDMFR